MRVAIVIPYRIKIPDECCEEKRNLLYEDQRFYWLSLEAGFCHGEATLLPQFRGKKYRWLKSSYQRSNALRIISEWNCVILVVRMDSRIWWMVLGFGIPLGGKWLNQNIIYSLEGKMGKITSAFSFVRQMTWVWGNGLVFSSSSLAHGKWTQQHLHRLLA